MYSYRNTACGCMLYSPKQISIEIVSPFSASRSIVPSFRTVSSASNEQNPSVF